MILVYCTACFTGARVLGPKEELWPLIGPASEFWPDKFKCVRCDGAAQGALELEVDMEVMRKLKLVEVTAQELFTAQMGLGLPDEQGCDFTTVRNLFLNKRVVRVKGATVPNTNRSVLECLFFEDGTRLYLGSSPHGAVVYRLAKPFLQEDT